MSLIVNWKLHYTKVSFTRKLIVDNLDLKVWSWLFEDSETLSPVELIYKQKKKLYEMWFVSGVFNFNIIARS